MRVCLWDGNLNLTQVRAQAPLTPSPADEMTRGERGGPDVKICYFPRETVGQVSAQVLYVFAQSEATEDVVDVEVILLHVIHQVVLHIGHPAVEVKWDGFLITFKPSKNN